MGINTVIFSQSGGYQGIGFAVSSNLARRVMNDLQRYGEVRRGSIGYVQIQPLTPQLAQQLGVTGTQGFVVMRIGRGVVGVPCRHAARRRDPHVQRRRR